MKELLFTIPHAYRVSQTTVSHKHHHHPTSYTQPPKRSSTLPSVSNPRFTMTRLFIGLILSFNLVCMEQGNKILTVI